ncbi:hypothetical protein [Corynebacterium afermentans]|uniref:hypothetical protein n=1 Tax=Corynebacterium afermentans TaxID=38286 RepID=UPI003B968BF0
MIDMVSTTLSCEPICPQLVRRASDHSSGGRNRQDQVRIDGHRIDAGDEDHRRDHHGQKRRPRQAGALTYRGDEDGGQQQAD